FTVTDDASASSPAHLTSALPATVTVRTTDPNADYVAEVFHALLHRDADPGALAFFTNYLSHGGSRFAFVQSVQNEPTFKEYFKVEVNEVYLALLHRAADPQALAAD